MNYASNLNKAFSGVLLGIMALSLIILPANAVTNSTLTITTNSVWQGNPITAQNGKFTATFDAIPNGNNMDGVIGLSSQLASKFTDLAAIVRFNTNGNIDARNGSSYQAQTAIPYTAGNTYTFRLAIDIPNHSYDIYVTPQGSSEKTVGLGYAFRTEQSTATDLNYINAFADAGSETLSNTSIQSNSPTTSTTNIQTSSSTVNISTSTSNYYGLNANRIITEADSMSASADSDWWLSSGAYFYVNNGVGKSITGSLPSNDPWRILYNSTNPVDTDNGYHPQNIFRLVTKSSNQNESQQAYFNVSKYWLSSSPNRNASNGIFFFNRYVDQNNVYYTGIRVDGQAVIKKKENGAYYTLALNKVYSGNYNQNSNPNLIPLNTWIGLRSVVTNQPDGSVLIQVYIDKNNTGNWVLAVQTTDNGSQGGSPMTNTGYGGVRTDFMDASFKNYVFSNSSVAVNSALAPISTLDPVSASVPASTYDSLILADNPVMYFSMNSSSSGHETDLSGHGNDGTYKGGTPSTVAMPNGDIAADFNGSSEYLTVPSNPALSIPTTGQLTWEGWVRLDTLQFPNASGDGYVDWMGKCENYSPSCEWEARLYSAVTPENRPNRFSAYVFNPSAGLGSAADWQPVAGLFKTGMWVYVVAEYDTTQTPPACSSAYPGTINIWVDGVKQDFAAHAPTGCMSQYDIAPKAGSSPLTIGTMAMDTWFKGAVGKVAVYDHLLSQAQIDAHYETMTGKTPAGSCGNTCTITNP